MAQHRIGIGDTSSFRYIAVEPPLSTDLVGRFLQTVELPKWIAASGISPSAELIDNAPEVTEFWYDVGDALDYLGENEIDDQIIKIAEKLAQIIEISGNSVELYGYAIPTDFQNPIFGSGYEMMREEHYMQLGKG